MLGKRKRGKDNTYGYNLQQDVSLDVPCEALPLTESNLNLLSCSMPGSSSQSKEKSQAYVASEQAFDETATSTSLWTLSPTQILEVHSFFIDRFEPYPPDLQILVDSITEKIPGIPTPISEKVKNRWRDTRYLSERNASAILENMLGYQGEIEHEEGETGIFRDRDRQWNKASVPVKDNSNGEEIIQAILDRAGMPTTPKPDIIYGYSNTSFDHATRQMFNLLPQQALTTPDQPWFPYFIIEWKSTRYGGTLREAEIQARRDGAAANNALYNLYQSLGINPSASQTAVFIACIDSDKIFMRVHWRNVALNGNVSFEADLIGAALLYQPDKIFEVRCMIRNILDWAKGDRLADIRLAFENGTDIIAKSIASRQSPKKKRAATGTPRKCVAGQRPPTPTLTTSTLIDSPVRDPKRLRVTE